MKRLLLDWRTFSAVSLVAVLLAAVIGGPKGAAGMLIGLSAVSGGMLASWGVIRLLAKASEGQPQSSLGTSLVVLAFLLKLPLIFLSMWFTWRIGKPADTCFLMGLGLVYCRLIGQTLSTN